MKNQNLKKRIQSEKKNKEEKGQEDILQKTNEHAQSSSQKKSQEKMKIKVDENFQLELEKEKEKEKKPKIKIFNNKKNNGICSELLKSTLINEKELVLLPYAKEKQKVFKTLNTIGNAHGISYPALSVIKGGSLNDKNYLTIIRDDKKKKRKIKKDLTLYKKNNKAEINLDNDLESNNLKEMLGDKENIKDYI